MEPQILDLNESTNIQHANYAGFWIRFGAAFIDGILLGIIQVIANFIFLGTFLNNNFMGSGIAAIIYIFNLLVGLLYSTLLESSSKQATIGKMAVGIRVTDLNGERISFGKALGRHLSKFISAIILGIGYIMAGFDEKKRALHDKIAGTYVIYK
jgi:uncharacterized RDD family membrane protein YckC